MKAAFLFLWYMDIMCTKGSSLGQLASPGNDWMVFVNRTPKRQNWDTVQ